MLKKTLVTVAAGIALMAGCAQNTKQAKDTAAQKWNSARASVSLTLAQDQYKTGNFDKARQSVDEGLKLAPNSAALRILSAKLAIEQGQLDHAQKELEVARTLNPDDAEALYLSGVVCQRWQREQEAYDYYHAAVEKAPGELAYLMAESEMLVSMDRTDEALALLQARVVYFEHSGGIRDAVARLMMQKGRYREAVELFRQATILTPDEVSFREGLGMALYHAKQFKEAAVALGKLAASDDAYAERADVRFALGESLLQTGKIRDAREHLEVAARIQPANAGAWLALARAALQLDDARRADASVKRALALQPQAPAAHLMLGYVRLRENKLHDALQAFTKASTLDRTDPVSVCMVGYVFERLGRSDAAVQCYARALKLKPDDEMASQLMAGINLND